MNKSEQNLDKKFNIAKMYNDGLTKKEIHCNTNIPKSTIHDIITKYKRHGTIIILNGSDWHKTLNDYDRVILIKYVESDPKKQEKAFNRGLNLSKEKLNLIEQSEICLNK